MTNYKSNFNFKSKVLSILIFFLIFTLAGCAKKIPFQTSAQVPAARGNITYSKDKNNNYNIKLEISYLAEPNRLQPAKAAYVVWLESDQSSNPINLGQIVGTSKLKIKFETVSSSKPKRIFVTAEDDPTIHYPGSYLVLETSYF
jgi:predicted small lipoprotein YifL